MSAAAGPRKLAKGEYLFREGDASDAMYVIKTGKVSITKNKGEKDIELAQVGPGNMIGEMAFFDNMPRSANARAAQETVVIALPFASLLAQFKTFPEWLKSMVRTINENLREANKRIKNLERVTDETERFPPHTITKLCAILGLVAHRYGKPENEGIVIPGTLLRRYTIQIFQEPTAKMQTVMEVLQAHNFLKLEDQGAGQQKITIFKVNELIQFVDYYNEYLFKEDSKRTTIEQVELLPLKAVIFYGKNSEPDKNGFRKAELFSIRDNSMKDLQQQIKLEEFESLINKKVLSDKMAEPTGGISVKFNLEELEQFYNCWNIVYAIKRLEGRH